MEKIVVIGASGHAKVVIDAIERSGDRAVVGLLDDSKPRGEEWYGYEILGSTAELGVHLAEQGIDGFVVAVGDGSAREKVAKRVREAHASLPWVTVVHPGAELARGVELGAGNVIMPGAVLGPDCRLGEGCIVNTNASIDHDCVLRDFAAISPGAALGGQVTVGRQSFVGVGASVLHGLRIGDQVVIGAGAVVIADVPDYTVAVGVPARATRRRSAGERYL